MMEPLLTGLALEKDMMAAPKETVSKKYGWDCGVVNRLAIVDATESVLERMDELAAVIDVRDNELYEARKWSRPYLVISNEPRIGWHGCWIVSAFDGIPYALDVCTVEVLWRQSRDVEVGRWKHCWFIWCCVRGSSGWNGFARFAQTNEWRTNGWRLWKDDCHSSALCQSSVSQMWWCWGNWFNQCTVKRKCLVSVLTQKSWRSSNNLISWWRVRFALMNSWPSWNVEWFWANDYVTRGWIGTARNIAPVYGQRDCWCATSPPRGQRHSQKDENWTRLDELTMVCQSVSSTAWSYEASENYARMCF